jgi:hypothetical protein
MPSPWTFNIGDHRRTPEFGATAMVWVQFLDIFTASLESASDGIAKDVLWGIPTPVATGRAVNLQLAANPQEEA